MKKLLVVGIIILLVGVSVPSTGTNVEKSDTSYVDESYSELDYQLSKYGLETRDTIRDFEQVLYRLIYRGRWINPFLSYRLKKEVANLSDVLHEMGISKEMTIAEALPIIEENKEILQKEGINLFCSIEMNALSGNAVPLFRLFIVIFGSWLCEIGFEGNYLKIESSIIGLQYCEDQDTEDKVGGLIGLIGFDPPVIRSDPPPVGTGEWMIRGDFSLYSKSNVPFVNYSYDHSQNPLPTVHQISNENISLNNVHEGFGGYVK